MNHKSSVFLILTFIITSCGVGGVGVELPPPPPPPPHDVIMKVKIKNMDDL